MKKWIALTLSVILALGLCACGDNDDGEKAENKKVTVSLLTEIVMVSEGDDAMKAVLEYDEDYNLIGNKTYRDGELYMEVTYNKDISKPLIQQEYDEDGEKASRWEYTYDEDGSTLSHFRYDEDGEKQYGYTYTYDKDGNKLTEKYYDPDGLVSTYTYTYNEDGKVLTFVTTWPDNDDVHFREYTYNQQGDLVTEAHGYDDQVTGTTTYDHLYTGGKLVESTGYQDGEKFQMIQYDKDGNMTLKCEYADGDESTRTEYSYKNGKRTQQVYYSEGEEISRYLYTFNDDGNLTEQVSYYEGKELYKFTYAYDDSGNVVGMSNYNDGELSGEYTMTYESVTVSKETAKKIEKINALIAI